VTPATVAQEQKVLTAEFGGGKTKHQVARNNL
jgi:hypothetical protein